MRRRKLVAAYLLGASLAAGSGFGFALSQSRGSMDTASNQAFEQRPAHVVGRRHVPPSLSRLTGQRFVGRITGTWPSRRLIARVRAGQLGGVIVFSDNVASAAKLRRLIAVLQAAARAGHNPPLLVAIDQEGGAVKRLDAGPPWLSAAEMGSRGAASAAGEGLQTATYLRRLGVNVDLAPVLDTPSVNHWLGSRAFSTDAIRVARVGVAFARGLQRSGVASTAKHFPGLGAAVSNTDTASVSIRASRGELLRALEPFRAAVRAGTRLVMVSNAAYPALDRSGRPAVVSRPIVSGLLRQNLSFRGVAISDAIETPALRRHAAAPAEAMAAGIDLLLYASTERASERAFHIALAAARNGRLSKVDLQRSYSRIIALKRWLQQRPSH